MKRAGLAGLHGLDEREAVGPDTMVGGVEAGGTKWVCAVSSGDGRSVATVTIPTTTPTETISQATEFFLQHRPAAVGIAAFGPIDLHPSSPAFGHITTTPKPGWAYTDVVSPMREALAVPVVIDTDVNAAALAEWLKGAGAGLETFSYITVGTGIGGGAVVNGRIVHGHLHPELGHIRIPHDHDRDPFDGTCPFHGDCFEGLASGEALRRRWGRPAEQLVDPDVWDLEADYLALGLLNVIFTLAPQRIAIGGGVLKQHDLLSRIHRRLPDLVAGYVDLPRQTEAAGISDYVVRPGLGDRSGIVGALELARRGLVDELRPAIGESDGAG